MSGEPAEAKESEESEVTERNFGERTRCRLRTN